MSTDQLLHFIEYDLQIIALSWLVFIYAIKVIQIMRLPMPWEKGNKRGNAPKGVLLSYGAIFMPWSMEISRQNIWRWGAFSLYHIAALVAIVNTFTYPFAPEFMTYPIRIIFVILIAPAILVGFIKLANRMLIPELRIISTADDYFSLIMMQLFFFFAVMALMTDGASWRMAYFLITAFFLFYVPFSKISHYIYFFFARFLTGKRYGWRGVIPIKNTES